MHHEAGGLDGLVGDVGDLSNELQVPSVIYNPLVDKLLLDFEWRLRRGHLYKCGKTASLGALMSFGGGRRVR